MGTLGDHLVVVRWSELLFCEVICISVCLCVLWTKNKTPAAFPHHLLGLEFTYYIAHWSVRYYIIALYIHLSVSRLVSM